MTNEEALAATKGLPSKAAKMRALDDAGMLRADIARFLDVKYQQVFNTLKDRRPEADSRGQKRTHAAKLVIQESGAVLIPAHFVSELGVGVGEEVFALRNGGELRLVSKERAIEQIERTVRDGNPQLADILRGLLSA
jgi:antitoxin component of MazEF toxin-antitoxin module